MANKIKSIVTGGYGFIGSHLVDYLLAKGHQVIVVDNLSSGNLKNLDHINKDLFLFFNEDINNINNSKEHFIDCDYIFHIAGLADVVPSIDKPLEYYNSNVNGTLEIANLARENKNLKKIIYAASSSCYGIPKEVPTSEKCPIDIRYPYSHSKYIGENLLMHFSKIYKIPTISLRFFNVYGLRARTTGTYGAVFGTFLAQKLAGKPFTIVGDGNQGRDFIFISDLIEGIYSASICNEDHEIFNIGSGEPHTINELVNLIGGDKIYIPKRPGEPDITHANISKIKKKLNWKPKVSFEKGVKILSDNILNWKDAPVWTPEKINKATENWFKHLS